MELSMELTEEEYNLFNEELEQISNEGTCSGIIDVVCVF